MDDAEPVALTPAARDRVLASRAVVERRARGDEPAYGINTGFGSFADGATAVRELSQSGLEPANCRLLDGRDCLLPIEFELSSWAMVDRNNFKTPEELLRARM